MNDTINHKQIVDVEALLRDYNKNPENIKLRSLYNSTTIFDILGKGRNETAHSSFLNWMLTSDEMRVTNTQHPLIGLLDTLTRRISQQYGQVNAQQSEENPYGNIAAISNALLARRLRLDNIKGGVEVPVSEITLDDGIRREVNECSKTKKDSIDIYITCDVSGVEGIEKFEFIIENKIGSKEGGAKGNLDSKKGEPSENSYAKMSQTQRYYYACNKTNNDSGIYQFFIFLTPASESELKECGLTTSESRLCQSKNFVCINYQDIYEDVIFPLTASNQLLDREEYLIGEYVRTLSIPTIFKSDDSEDDDAKPKDIESSIILATSKEEKELLTNYWDNNQQLIFGALQAYVKTANEDEGLGLVGKEWQRLIDQWDNLYTRYEYIQAIFDYIKRKWDNDPYYRKHTQYKYLYESSYKNLFSTQGSANPFIKIELNKEYSSTPIHISLNNKELTLPQIKKLSRIIKVDANKIPKDLENFNYKELIIDKFNEEAEKITCCEFFNNKAKNPGSGVTQIICDKTNKVHNTHNGDKLDEIIHNCLKLCETWPDCPKVEMLDYQLDKNKNVLNNFWQVNKSLIMAAVRIMSENDNISDETKKAIKKAYEELRSRDKSYYRVTLEENKDKELEGSKLAIYRWFAQTLLWDSSKPNLKGSNKKLKEITGKSKLLSKNENNTSWTKLNRPKWCQQGESDSDICLYTGNYTSIFPKIIDYLNSQEAKNKGYTIVEIKR